MIKTTFTIKDLENLSGIKAHTIRIWEKRYNLLTPERTDSNIRYYNITNLQKLLNVSLLYDQGYKISEISQLPEKHIPVKIRELATANYDNNQAMNSLKVAMLNFDRNLFDYAYNQLLSTLSFREVFKQVLIPFLEEIGLLWSSDSITPAHEHFVSSLIKQKLHSNIEKLPVKPLEQSEKLFVLFLPLNEIHELGLLYLHFEIILHGYHSIYLGHSVPIESLSDLAALHKEVVFVCSTTTSPETEDLVRYIASLKTEILKENNYLWMYGHRVEGSNLLNMKKNKKIELFSNLNKILDKL